MDLKTDMRQTILRTLVGSQAHGLATERSDFDYRSVFIYPTREILKLGSLSQTSQELEDADSVAWEVEKFLLMAIKCNPTVLEVMRAPASRPSQASFDYTLGSQLQELFPFVWNSVGVKNAFCGYAFNQRKKFLNKTDTRGPKYAVAHLRVLYTAWELLTTGTFSVDMSTSGVYQTLKNWKAGNYTVGEVLEVTEIWEKNVNQAFEENPHKETDLEEVNKFLVGLRKKNW
ncbi:MAG: nucleotidyltransferase domain-containing protein [Rhodobacteraceae bacterium]|nr:nucleotidyltransferase domain-containing protein [Paracoccaceae bacterium]